MGSAVTALTPSGLKRTGPWIVVGVTGAPDLCRVGAEMCAFILASQESCSVVKIFCHSVVTALFSAWVTIIDALGEPRDSALGGLGIPPTCAALFHPAPQNSPGRRGSVSVRMLRRRPSAKTAGSTLGVHSRPCSSRVFRCPSSSISHRRHKGEDKDRPHWCPFPPLISAPRDCRAAHQLKHMLNLE